MTDTGGLQGVMNRFMAGYRRHHRLSPRQRQVCEHIRACRTAALGGLKLSCDHCDYDLPQYHACRDRHCPRCQQRASRAWCERQQHAVLPVTYHHVVFTLPHALNPWVQLHPQVIYRLLFESVWATLKAFGADPKRLGGELGMTAVLHTWGQNLSRHVHLHCLIPGGALTVQGHWRPAKSTYLFPIRALSRHVRGRMVSALRSAHRRGELDRITRPGEVDNILDTLMQRKWVVYSKTCLSRTETVIDYLGRYSHRIALSDRRILGIDDDQVSFRYKDYRDGGRNKEMRLAGEELIRRYLMHVLPKGLMRIRHYGFLANRGRNTKLEHIRACLEPQAKTDAAVGETAKAAVPPVLDGYPCPKCRQGTLRVRYPIAPRRWEGGG